MKKQCVSNPDNNCLKKFFDVFDKNKEICTQCPNELRPVIKNNHYTNFIPKNDGSFYGEEMFNFVYNFGYDCIDM